MYRSDNSNGGALRRCKKSRETGTRNSSTVIALYKRWSVAFKAEINARIGAARNVGMPIKNSGAKVEAKSTDEGWPRERVEMNSA